MIINCINYNFYVESNILKKQTLYTGCTAYIKGSVRL